MTLNELATKWEREAQESMERAVRNGAPYNVVTEERMRWLVFQWVNEMHAATKSSD